MLYLRPTIAATQPVSATAVSANTVSAAICAILKSSTLAVAYLAMLGTALAGTTRANDFPYGARISTKTAAVRSGPGAKYYATDRLPNETRVEVYRHDDDWAAIRPPSGSFSWVPATAVELTEDTTIGYIARDGVRTRIGSRLSDERSAVYIELQADEEVTILARRTLDEDGKPTRWYQIEPPAGEFRWVQLSSLEPLPNPLAKTDDAQALDDVEPIAATTTESQSDVELAQFVEDAPSLLVTDGDTTFAEPTPAQSNDATQSDGFPNFDTPAPVARNESENEGPWKLESTGQPVADQPTAPFTERSSSAGRSVLSPTELDTIRSRPRQVNPALLQQELAKINLELTRQIVRDPTVWSLGEFRARTQAVIDLSATNELREQAQNLLSRIAQFEDIKRRHTDLARGVTDGFLDRSDLAGFADPSSFPMNENLVGLQPRTLPPPAPQSQTPGSAYDGSGWLMPVVTRQAGVPRYALTDDSGNILHFVSPRPGLNLRNYEKRRIGIIGQKGFVPRYNKSHLTAERIISLDKVRF